MERFAHVVDLEEMEANDFTVNTSFYEEGTESVGDDVDGGRLGPTVGGATKRWPA